jgi:hypothetical protein
MKAIVGSVQTGRRVVQIIGIAPDRPVSDDFIAGFAYASARETPAMGYGSAVTRTSSTTASVTIYTD